MMKVPFPIPLVKYFFILQRDTGPKLYIYSGVVLLAGFLEGLGITLFLPLLGQSGFVGAAEHTITTTTHRIVARMGYQDSLGVILALIVVVFLGKALVMFGSEKYKATVLAEVTQNMRAKLLGALARVDYTHYLTTNVGHVTNMVTTEVTKAVGAFNFFCDVLASIITVAIFIFIAFFLNAQLTGFAIFFAVVFLFFFRVLARLSKIYSVRQSEESAVFQGLLIQCLEFFKYLRATSGIASLMAKLQEANSKLARLSYRLWFLNGVQAAFAEPMVVVFLVGVIAYYVAFKHVPMAGILVTLLLFYRVMSRTARLQMAWQKFLGLVGGVDVVETGTQTLRQHPEASGDQHLPSFQRVVEFSHVAFAFGDKQVLADITLTIPKNSMVALVGPSGAGKTTLVDLLTGLLSPTRGSISIDGIDYRSLSLTSLRHLIGYVTQEGVIFYDTIANNISFGGGDGRGAERDEQIKRAASLAGGSDFIADTAHGYETVVGDRGIKLSGGQRQRLAIARELFRDPQILILDEATSALDSESEVLIKKSIDALKGHKTVVVIAHRLATIKDCDYVYVLNHGSIVEEGCFTDLYSRTGSLLRKMCELQQL